MYVVKFGMRAGKRWKIDQQLRMCVVQLQWDIEIELTAVFFFYSVYYIEFAARDLRRKEGKIEVYREASSIIYVCMYVHTRTQSKICV